MKGHLGMYLILGAIAVAFLSRPAAASGEMVAGGSVVNSTLGVITGQYAQSGGSKGTFSLNSPAGAQSFSLG